MSFKISVSNTVQVPVKFTMRDGGSIRQFAFTLTGQRCLWDDYKEQHLGESMTDMVTSYLKDNVTDWSGQRFVILENNEPAPFSPEAFDAMLKGGALNAVFAAYTNECVGKTKN